MSKSLQDQLLGAGLVDKKKAKNISKEQRKNKNEKRRSKDNSLSEAQAAAQKAQQEKAARDKALNAQRDQEAAKKALTAQVAQLVNHYKIKRDGGDQEYNFSDGKKIKKLWLKQQHLEELVRGRLCLARHKESYELIPKPIADKIRERNETAVVVYNSTTNTNTSHTEKDTPVDSDEAYYAQFEIPDDLNW